MIVEQLWTELESQRTALPGLVRRRVREDSDRNLFLGVTHPAMTRMLILVVDAGALRGITEDLSTRALRTEIVPVERGLVEVRVSLMAPEMARVFTPFVDDVLAAVGGAPSDSEAVQAFITRFSHWRRLLASTQPEGLGAMQAQGLYGELWALRHVVLAAVNGGTAIGGWHGPERLDRDFAIGGVAIEVKTTIRDNPLTVAITGERQLDLAAFSQLFLLALAIDALPAGGGQTLNALVDELLVVLPTENERLALRDKLLDYGYAPPHRERYAATRYSLREARAYEVREGFPRIVEADLLDGVGEVRYLVSLPACEPWRASIDDLKSVLRRSKA